MRAKLGGLCKVQNVARKGKETASGVASEPSYNERASQNKESNQLKLEWLSVVQG